MTKIKEIFQKPLYAAITGAVLGLALGLFVLGWWLWPVQWYDAAPKHLSQAYQSDYLCMAVDSYTVNNDPAIARGRFEALDAKGQALLQSLVCQTNNAQAVTTFKAIVGMIGSETTSQAGFPSTTATPSSAKTSSSPFLLVVLCLATLAVGAALFYFFVLRGRKRQSGTQPIKSVVEKTQKPEKKREDASREDQPVSQFMTTYVLGDDLYDDSFSIDSPAGEFLGECGVGISETIGVGDPKKVTAFEIWLFDKNDIQTVTKILMSKHAYHDQKISQRMNAKGELIMVQPGQQILLETATLQLEAHIVDASYGEGALPAGSFFDRLTLELNVWQKV
jgi:hypothetical protein